MTCDQVRALFSELADGVLGPAERAACQGHLSECPECRREWEGFQRMLGLLHALPRLRAPAGFAARVVAAAEAQPWHRRLLRRLFVPLPLKLPLEAAALVLVVGLVALIQRAPEMREATRLEVPAPMRDAASPPPAGPVRAPASPPSAREPVAARGLAAPPAAAPPPSPAERPEATSSTRDQGPPPPASAPSESKAAAGAAEAPIAAPAPGVVGNTQAYGRLRSRESTSDARQSIAVVTPPTISGRLAAADPQAAERALAELVARHGATEIAHRRADDATIVELDVPRGAWPEFSRALAGLGAWTPESSEPAELPARVRVLLRLTR